MGLRAVNKKKMLLNENTLYIIAPIAYFYRLDIINNNYIFKYI